MSAMTKEQLVAGMLERQRRILKLRGKPKESKPSDKVIDRLVRPKGKARLARAHERYQRRLLGKLGAASKVRHLVKDGKPVRSHIRAIIS
jgi:hypothetical protein